MDDAYIVYLLSEDMHTQEDFTNGMGELEPMLSGTRERKSKTENPPTQK